MTLAAGRVLGRSDGLGRRTYVRAFSGNLVLDTAWSWIFFRARRPAPAAVEAALLAASTADLARRSWAQDRLAGVALVPYVLWTAFAAVLTSAIARRNRSGRAASR